MGKPYWSTGRRALIALLIMALLAPLSPAVYSSGDDDDNGHHGDNDDDDGFSLPPDFVQKIKNLIRCLISCIKLTLECRSNCTPQCAAVYAQGTPQFTACWNACQNSCTLQRQNCVAICKFEFTGVTPELP